MEARAAKAQLVEALQLGEAHVLGHQGDPEIAPVRRRERVLRHAQVRAVQRRVHDDTPLDAQVPVQREQLVLVGVRRIDRRARRPGKARLRAEDMKMRIP